MTAERYYFTKGLASVFWCMHLLPVLLVKTNCVPWNKAFAGNDYKDAVAFQLILVCLYAISVYILIFVFLWGWKIDEDFAGHYSRWLWFLFKIFTRIISLWIVFTLIIMFIHFLDNTYLIYGEFVAFVWYMSLSLLFAIKNKRGIFRHLHRSPSARMLV